MKQIDTKLFGTISYTEKEILNFPRGLVGLENLKTFLLLSFEEYEPLKFLQSTDKTIFSFTLINPYVLKSDYEIKLEESDYSDISLKEGGGILVYVILTIPEDPSKITANFLAPIVVNPESMKAKQLVLVNSDYSATVPIKIEEDRVFVDK